MRVNGGQVALVAAALGLGVAGNRFLRRLKAIDLSGKVVLSTGGSRGLGLVNRLLPGIGSDATAKERWMGKESTTALSSSFLTILGEKAAHEYNESQEP